MRVLLSAYACEPATGSEPGVGWHWATELARLGHEVSVITRSNNRDAIDKAMADAPIAGLQFHYYDLPSWGRWWKRGSRGIDLYYWLWQHGAYRLAKRLTDKTQFDLVHHVTFGMYRQPSYMGRLGLPFAVGPLGGGEMTPVLLRSGFPARNRLKEKMREASNRLACWNPSVRAMFRQATVILCKTPETLAIVPAECRKKSRVVVEIGLEAESIRQETAAQNAGANFLYAGRLVYWKGLHLALKALFELRRERPDATLTVIGAGRDEARLKKLSATLRLQDSVRWLGAIPHEEMRAHYSSYTAFVFPSLHDSSGNVLLEALSQGLPAICLDTGGPGAIVSRACGIKIPVEKRNEKEVIADLAAAMQELAGKRELRAEMGRCALEAARASTWRNVVSSAYAYIEEVLNASGKSAMDRMA